MPFLFREKVVKIHSICDMANKRVKRVKLSPPETLHRFLELPLHDLMVPGISKYLKLKDIFNFRCCSRYCKELAESALAHRRRVEISALCPQKPGNKKFFCVIVKHCRRLREIKLCSLPWLTDAMLIALFNNNPLLEDVLLSNCTSVTPKALYPLAVNCKNLTSFQLYGNTCNDTFLEMLNQHEIQLEKVLLWCYGISEEGLCSFFRKQPRLTYIAVPELDYMFHEVFVTIAESCQELRSLYMQPFYCGYQDDTLEWFLKACPKLETIGLCEYRDFSHSLWYAIDAELSVVLDTDY